MRRNVILKNREKQSSGKKKNRFLVSVNVLGSAGPIRFVVYEDDSVASVIDTALRLYAREGRLPVLGSDVGDFLLYPVNAGSDCAMSASELIGSSGGRSFLLFKKHNQLQKTEIRSEMISKKGSSSWKAWLNKPFKLLSSH